VICLKLGSTRGHVGGDVKHCSIQSNRGYANFRDLRSFVIRFDFESYVRCEIRFVLMVRFEIFESSALSILIRKETIGGG